MSQAYINKTFRVGGVGKWRDAAKILGPIEKLRKATVRPGFGFEPFF
jgi:hypothetical protein